MDGLGIFCASWESVGLDPHQSLGWGWCSGAGLSHPVVVLLIIPRQCFFCGCFLLFVFGFAILLCLFPAAL